MRRRMVAVIWLVLALVGTGPAASAQADGEILLLNAEGPLTPAMAGYLERGLAMA